MSDFLIIAQLPIDTLDAERKAQLRIDIAEAGFKTKYLFSNSKRETDLPDGTYRYTKADLYTHQVIDLFNQTVRKYFQEYPKVICVSFKWFSSSHTTKIQ